MSHAGSQITRMSRRVALVGLASTVGFVIAGCSNATSTSASTPVATLSTQKKSTATPTPQAITPQATSTSVPLAQPGTTLFTYKGHTTRVLTLAWSPDSKAVASIEQMGVLHVWNAANGTPIFIGKTSLLGNTCLAWSANGKYIAGANSTGVSVWDANNGSLITTYTGQQQAVISLAFSPDNTRIATGAMDKTVHIWQTTTGANILTYNGHNIANGVPVVSLSWSPDGKQIVSSTSLRGGAGVVAPNVKVWDASSGTDILTYSNTSTNAVAWAPNGLVIASEAYVNSTEVVQLWAPATGRGTALTIDQEDAVKKISWSPASKYIALVVSSYQAIVPTSRIEVHCVSGSAYTLTYKGHQPNVNDVAWSPDGTRIASCADDKTVQIWQAPN